VGARTKARKRALDVLFEADLRAGDPTATLRERLAQSDPAVPDYTVELVEGVVAHRTRIDELLTTYVEGWPLDRMPAVDRAILRVGVYELLWGDVPEGVAISEAVGLATRLSTEDSPRFVNGVLARLLSLKPSLSG